MSGTYILRKGKARLSDLADGNGAFGYPGDYPGRIYYVNNITGSANNTGLSWGDPFAQVSQAITASETYRAAYSGTTNDYVRNIIYVQGTGTMYTYLTALPNYTDVIGIGADPRGNGAGIVVIGSNGAYDGATGSGGSTDMRGTNWYNIQFVTGNGATYAFHAPVAYRCIWENCTFGTGDSAAAAPLGGLYIESGSGVTIRNCSTVQNKYANVTALKVGNSGGNFSQCLVEDNVFYGSTAGIVNSAYLCNETVFRNNFIYGATYGVQDTSTESTLAGNAWYVDNRICSAASNGFAITNNGTLRCVGNQCNEAGTTVWEDGI